MSLEFFKTASADPSFAGAVGGGLAAMMSDGTPMQRVVRGLVGAACATFLTAGTAWFLDIQSPAVLGGVGFLWGLLGFAAVREVQRTLSGLGPAIARRFGLDRKEPPK